MNDLRAVATRLLEATREMPIIDAHEHLPAEDSILRTTPDLFNRILCCFTISDALAAGLQIRDEAGAVVGFDATYRYLNDPQVPLDHKWRQFAPYLAVIRETGYMQAALAAARDIYGVEDISDTTYAMLDARIKEANRPGLYDRILRGLCRIHRLINQGGWQDGGFCRSVNRDFIYLDRTDPTRLRGKLDELSDTAGAQPADAAEFVRSWVEDCKRKGFVGLKYRGNLLCREPIDDKEAGSLYRKLRRRLLTPREVERFASWAMRASLGFAGDVGLVACVHTGLDAAPTGAFGFSHNPVGLASVFRANPRTRFDLYHAGLPWIRETAVLANQNINVHLDLCWCHQIAPHVVASTINEILDLVPSNKIVAFGGDSCFGPEKTWGALSLARWAFSRALAQRIEEGFLSESRAVDLWKRLFYDNPVAIYGLES